MQRERVLSADRMALKIEIDREVDGRWIAEIPALPGVMAYGRTRREAVARAKALALRVLADRIERETRTATSHKQSAVPSTFSFALR